ncbi:MAG: hydrolase [Clostridia bacterium]|nr:hydrolase [Clostridia bacterium]
MQYNVEDYKKEFIRIFEENITREGANKLLEWLKKSDFFYAPASTRFHSAHIGGLCEHSVKTYYRFLQNLEMEYAEDLDEKISQESIAVIALLHDLCKVNTYKVEYRNVKVDGNWEQKPYYSTEDNLPYGHGEKSVYIISGFMKLTREEAMAINWHMGGFDLRVLGGSYALSTVFNQYPSALLFHVSDVQATYLDETQGE